MLIDWFTVCAQILNFVLLIWLLKRFLYRPILDAIEEREKRIAAQLKDAADQKATAQKEQEDFRRKNDEFDANHKTMQDQANTEVQTERKRMFDAARIESDELRTKLQEKLRSEQQTLNRQLLLRTQQEVFAIARKTLKDLANANLDDQIATVFVSRLQTLAAGEKADLVAAQKVASHPILVRSTFELTGAQQATIQTTLTDILGQSATLKFETATDLVSGIELLLDGHKVAWSIADYLGSMEQNAQELVTV
jgi:F-type H+-transporting ATPase subunit b